MNVFRLLLGLLLLSACQGREPLADSKSNWLGRCIAASDCDPDATCACGFCTKPCSSTANCGDLAADAVCVVPDAPGMPDSCSSRSQAGASGICLARCNADSVCKRGQRCALGACVGVAEPEDAGAQPAHDASNTQPPLDATGTNASATQVDAGVTAPAPPTSGDGALTGQSQTAIEVQCPAAYGNGRFGSQCQYIGGDLPELRCPDLAPSPVGAIDLVVRHPERIQVGVAVKLDGSDPDVTISVAFANSSLVQSKEGGTTSGTLVFDELSVGSVLRGTFVDVGITALPDPPFECRISNAGFVADSGPGVQR